jgi:hypothetical protein
METPQKKKKAIAKVLWIIKKLVTEKEVNSIKKNAGIHQFFIEKR